MKRHGEPKTPEDLVGHNCIIGNNGPVWPFQNDGRPIQVSVRGCLVVTGGDALREAALLGLGITQANWWTFRHDLGARTLRPLLQLYAVEGNSLNIVYPPTRHVPSKLRAMIDFLVSICR